MRPALSLLSARRKRLALTLGHARRDLGSHEATFKKIVEQFGAQSEDVRRSAAFAAGNIAVGNSSAFLPTILELIQSDDKKRYLALQALKEVIIHSTPEALASTSDTLWTPLFENCEAQEEGTRNVAADCLGQLTVINPAKYLPQLQARLSSSSHHTRATVIAALRFTFTNDSTTYDELLAPLIVEFFKLMHDSDLGVRRLALSSLNSAAHNKPHLVRSHLDTLLPELYAQTEIDTSLIRMVEMGPFKHKVDDGLDIRKTAYECMHSLLDTCLKDIDLNSYLSRIVAGLADEEEVKKLCYVMLSKMAQVAPTAVTQRACTRPLFSSFVALVDRELMTAGRARRPRRDGPVVRRDARHRAQGQRRQAGGRAHARAPEERRPLPRRPQQARLARFVLSSSRSPSLSFSPSLSRPPSHRARPGD